MLKGESTQKSPQKSLSLLKKVPKKVNSLLWVVKKVAQISKFYKATTGGVDVLWNSSKMAYLNHYDKTSQELRNCPS